MAASCVCLHWRVLLQGRPEEWSTGPIYASRVIPPADCYATNKCKGFKPSEVPHLEHVADVKWVLQRSPVIRTKILPTVYVCAEIRRNCRPSGVLDVAVNEVSGGVEHLTLPLVETRGAPATM